MIINLLKIIFLYFLYRFIKVLIKGFIIKKIKQASDQARERMKENIQNQRYSQNQPPPQKNGVPETKENKKTKTFEAEYKVLKD